MSASSLTQHALRTRLQYCFEDGNFYWLNPGRTNQKLVGLKAGSKTSEGYWKISVDGHNYLAHRLVFLYLFGRWPVSLLDHEDGDKQNNRVSNLREASDKLNAENKRVARVDNKSGFLGVSWSKKSSRWVAQIQVAGVKKSLGYFLSPEEAHSVYLEAKRSLHLGCTI